VPLTGYVSFKAVIQRNWRIQIPVLIRWKHKLEPGEIFRVELKVGYGREKFYGRMSKDGRLTVPKVIAKELLKESEEETLEGYTAGVALYVIRREKEDE